MSKIFRQKKKSLVMNGILILFAIVMWVVLSLTSYEIVNRLSQYEAARLEYTQLRDELGVLELVTAQVLEKLEYQESEIYKSIWQIKLYNLKSTNESIVGWIEVPGTSISYPIVQGDDNSWYLYHTISGQSNPSGAIFLDYRNNSDFTDRHSLIYGHNMRDGSMFAGLHTWDGALFFIHTKTHSLKFDVFNRAILCQYDELFVLPDRIIDDKRVVTLSTCVFGNDDLRYVVQGIYIAFSEDFFVTNP